MQKLSLSVITFPAIYDSAEEFSEKVCGLDSHGEPGIALAVKEAGKAEEIKITT